MGVALHTPHRIDRVLETYKFKSQHDFTLYMIYSHDNPVPEIVDKLKSHNLLVRENTGCDYGATRYLFNLKKNKYDRFVFLNDDVIFAKDNWLDDFHKAFEMGADVVSPCVCYNLKRQLIPRCCYWAATGGFLEGLPWPVPMTKADAYEQEMNLLPDYMKANNKTMYQVGNGNDMMWVPEYPPHRTECVFSNTVADGQIVKCQL